ncbi:S8 family serine peptidase [Alkalihalobacterium alkalinitrilicum]|uniref:S8 family serine peptidase n=1 Tax=Alkalihalobacterium alkalinitrilicum TaxID=427920 RepID=UPI0009955A5F|nr:S8 family serine peptidase [Alkalihalobacterium alkalinitrilicum]
MKKIYQAAFLVGGFIFLGLVILVLSNDDELGMQQTPPSTQNLERLEQKGMDQVLADDLSKTTSMFLSQLSLQLDRWAKQDKSDHELQSAFAKEVREHPHFHSFAIVDNGKLSETVGEINAKRVKQLHHQRGDLSFSDPYKIDGEDYFMIGKKLEDDKIVAGEIDLTFVKNFIKDMASVADANGNFFVSGNNPDVQWKTTKDLPKGVSAQTVPELDWQIVVHSDAEDGEEQHYIEGQAVIKLVDQENSESWIKEQADLSLIKNSDPYYVIQSETKTTDQLLNELSAHPDIEFVEPNFLFTKQANVTIPNDEFFQPYQWNLSQISAEEGWEVTDGSEGTTIAVLDTGVDPEHQDLKGKVLQGYNAFDGTARSNDQHGHGTHVAGIAAAISNNVTGIAGVAWQNNILPVKVLNEHGEGSSFEVARGIRWAVDNGAQVINMSLGDYHNSYILHDAIKYAHNNDVVLIAASGNDNVSDPMYPADYKEVLTVAATDDKRERAFFSNYGHHIDVAAPGEHIPSLFPNDNYVIMSGTSMAAPHVAGLAGLIRSIDPELTNEDVYELITSTAIDLGQSGRDPYYGAGEINVGDALRQLTN